MKYRKRDVLKNPLEKKKYLKKKATNSKDPHIADFSSSAVLSWKAIRHCASVCIIMMECFIQKHTPIILMTQRNDE